MNEADYWTAQAMQRYGGGFVQALGQAAQRADAENLRLIKATWPAIWRKYAVMAEALPGQQGTGAP